MLPFGLRPHSSKPAAIPPILSVKPLVLKQGEGQKEAVKAQKIAAAKQQKALAKSREWTSKNGKFNTRAEFIEYVKGKVKLRKIDGKIIEVSMVRLSSPDQKWVRAELKKRRAKKETAPKN